MASEIIHPKVYYKDGDYLHLISNDERNKRIIAEVEGGYLTIYHSYYDNAISVSVEFVNNNSVGSRQTTKVTKL